MKYDHEKKTEVNKAASRVHFTVLSATNAAIDNDIKNAGKGLLSPTPDRDVLKSVSNSSIKSILEFVKNNCA